MTQATAGARAELEERDFRAEVIARTAGMLGAFLDEISRGTSNYKSVHNLTEQIEHQYAGRFAIELIQNAHDPIRPDPGWNGGSRRIEVILDEAGPHGTLLVANDGRPFRPEDFNALASLGQSSKDPREAIGNKGIGFRSVLEVCRTPEIYSCEIAKPGAFSGYCFRFDPAVLDSFEAVVDRVFAAEDAVWRWDAIEERIEGVRRAEIGARAQREAGLDVRGEVRFLSPYSLPLPTEPRDAVVRELGERGFATVVRLPLQNGEAREKVENALQAISEETILFLPLVRSLALRTKGATRTYRREESPSATPLERSLVVISHDDGATPREPRRFWLWRRTYGAVPDAAPPDHPGHAERLRLAEAVVKLPGNWKDLREAEIAVAVEHAPHPRPGYFFIHLPTLQQTGVGAHLHAPFYGDMSRKAIDFKEERLNLVLLEGLAAFARQILQDELIGGGDEEGRAALDITARQVEGDASMAWRTALRRTGAMGLALYHTDRGWTDCGTARAIAAKPDAAVLTRETLRGHAVFAALSNALTSREEIALRQIRETAAFAGEPTGEERAKTVERVARTLAVRNDPDWTGFLKDVKAWVPSAELVAEVAILPDDKGALHAARAKPGGSHLFLPPVRGEGARGDGRSRVFA